MALGVAALIAGLSTLLLYRTMRGQKNTSDVRKIVAAAKAIDSGAVLTADNLVLEDWPATHVVAGSFSSMEEVKGKSLIYPVMAGQPILPNYLAAPGSGIGLTVKIPEGMRATSVRSNEVIGVAGFLYPGSHVDILASYKSPDEKGPVMQTVLQNVEILTAGQHVEPDPQGKAETVNVVTLLVTPQDSERLVLASQEGAIHFVLRNGADSTAAATTPVNMAELVGLRKSPETMTRAPATETKPFKRANETRPEVTYVVETIAGDKHVRDVFKADDPQ
jgi:pilus assembly protein CpaB